MRSSSRGGSRPGCLALPFALAARAFTPSRPGRVTDGTTETVQVLRTAVGIAATVWLLYAYPLRESAADFAKDQAAQTFIGAGVLLIAVPVALGIFVAAARPPARSLYMRRLAGPAKGFLALFAAVLVLWGLLQDSAGARLALQLGMWQIVFLPLALGAVLFAVPYGLTAVVLCVHYVFRAADVHEVLPALLSPVLVWALFAFQVADPSPLEAPAVVRMVFLFGPPASVTALSLWELRWLRRRFGITVRRALHGGAGGP
ncbi:MULTISPECIES: hypothetical protein [unclassified Streptomyces]|uniref:hypothetical protein n=1 Tax=unclassified Streptomyces TaxID=2593676 RepID=UPI00081DDAC9|nr:MULTISPECIES: hypothetical protein [unclassified Streptomyces]MYZ36680.1 hypothetical protein [Streptomyces sp. SID4917]SCF85438.1 hypothetical protein GA0115259_103672 [Streptomyces sp. MnatMP-M17]